VAGSCLEPVATENAPKELAEPTASTYSLPIVKASGRHCMSERKTEVVNLRMSPRVKELLRLAAAHERRTLSNMLEVLIEDFCEAKGLRLEVEAAKKTSAPNQH
jgi:hypothetical protein